MSTVLITTGATVTFTSLIQIILTPQFITNLINSGVNKLILQYGNEIKHSKHISTQFFHHQLKSTDLISHFKFDISEDINQTIILKNDNFTISAFPYTSNIGKIIDQSNIVISHAGTGSIIDTLRHHKKLIVVVNDQLMDNHQQEIANEFKKLNYCLSYNVKDLNIDLDLDLDKQGKFFHDLQDLINDKIKLDKFPDKDGSIMETIISEELEK